MAGGSDPDLELVFHNVSVNIGDKQILKDVYGAVRPGQILAIMGPSGAGKTTLLSCLSGRREVKVGEITVGGTCMNKSLRRKICYVLQHDVFFPNLTLLETLTFAAMVRLPDSMSIHEKMEKLQSLIDELGLCKCVNTPMGGMWMPGLSGGEMKRASIACELITDPDLILLDEPTSGLDYKTAVSLIHLLKQYASRHHKTVIATIHQPSSQMFLTFDRLLLMCDGHSVFYGSPRDITEFYSEAGFPMMHHYNPADFMLEKMKESNEVQEKIILTSLQTREVKTVDSESAEINSHTESKRTWNKLHWRPAFNHKKKEKKDDVNTSLVDVDMKDFYTRMSDYLDTRQRWPSGFLTQYKYLTIRAFRLSQSRLLDKFKIFENVFLCVLLCLIWYQLPRSEDTLRDRMGLIFYISMHWGFTPLFSAVTSFPGEKGVIYKERSAGWYRLSAYCLAKMSSEIPLLLIEPFLFLCAVYWVTGLNNVGSFFATIGTIFVHSIAGQSIGLCIGIYAMDFSRGISLSTIIIMFIMLSGGFYTRNLPVWLDWVKYLAFLHYTFHCLMYLEFNGGQDVSCTSATNATKSLFPSCHHGNSTEIPTIPPQEVLSYYEIDQPFWFYFLPLFAFVIVFRVLGYLLLRFYQKPH